MEEKSLNRQFLEKYAEKKGIKKEDMDEFIRKFVLGMMAS